MKGSIYVKIAGGFTLVAGLIIVVFAVSFVGMRTLGSNADRIQTMDAQTLLVSDTEAMVNAVWQNDTDYALTGNEKSLANAKAGVAAIQNAAASLRPNLDESAAKQLDDFVSHLRQFQKDGEAMAAAYLAPSKITSNFSGIDDAVLAQIIATGMGPMPSYSSRLSPSQISTMVAFYKGKDQTAAAAAMYSAECAGCHGVSDAMKGSLMSTWGDSARAMTTALGSLKSSSARLSQEAMSTADSAQSTATKIALVVAIIAILIATIVGVYLSGSMSKAIRTVNRAIRKIAHGDVTEKVAISSSDELGEMATAYGEMQIYLSDMSEVAERIAAGDLTLDVQPKSDKDKLGVAFARMTQGLRQLVTKVQESANTIASASEELSSSSEQSGSATNQIANVSQQIAKGAADQTKGIGQVNEAVRELDQAIDSVSSGSIEQANAVEKAAGIVQQVSGAARQTANSVQEAAVYAAQASDMARQGTATVRKTIDGMGKINRCMHDTARKVTELGKHSEQIGGMISVVDEIAAQTNLLALNAAIEAARAGEHGRGFAVVADEVKKLAERTARQTKEIAGLVESVQRGVSESIEASKEGAREAEEGSELVNEAGNALAKIVDVIHGMTSQIDQISAAAEQMSSSAGEMVVVVENVNKVAQQNSAITRLMTESKTKVSDSTTSVAAAIEQNSAATEQMSASAQEMSAQVQQVVIASKSLTDLSLELEKAASTFRLNRQVRRFAEDAMSKESSQRETVAA